MQVALLDELLKMILVSNIILPCLVRATGKAIDICERNERLYKIEILISFRPFIIGVRLNRF